MMAAIMTSHTRIGLAAALGITMAAASAAGCAAAPRQRPIKMGDVDTGKGSLEAERRRLLGTWSLLSYDMIGANGAKTHVAGQAQLTYDEFGNLKVVGEVNDPKIEGSHAESMLSYSGRAVIDPDKHEMRLLDMKTGTSNTTDTEIVQPDAVRHYEFHDNNQLEITLKDEAGKTVGVTSWKRVQ
jgi:hypothetical protein